MVFHGRKVLETESKIRGNIIYRGELWEEEETVLVMKEWGGHYL